VGVLVLTVLSMFEHMRSIRPSWLLNVYLLFTVLFDITRSRTYSLRPDLDTIATVFTSRVAMKLILAIIEARSKRKLLLPQFKDCPPEAMSGPYKRALFWWLNALFKKGYSESLTVDDLFLLDKHLQSDYLLHLLGSAWDRGKLNHSSLCYARRLNLTLPIVRRAGPYSLFTTTLLRLKWPVLAVLPPRICLIAFNFCQPFLINRAVTFSQEPVTSRTTNIGYGLIGAYVLVFVGIAVRIKLLDQGCRPL
jgi:ATP-binding cassette subfamily C (CFTR/MRP) protein 1